MQSRNFFAELKRRNVYKVAVAYGIVAWLLIQIATQTFRLFQIPDWATRLVVVLLIFGFPVALIFAWAFELTPEGLKRTEEIAPDQSIRAERAGSSTSSSSESSPSRWYCSCVTVFVQGAANQAEPRRKASLFYHSKTSATIIGAV